MLDWLDAIPNLGVPGVAGVQAQKSTIIGGTPAIIQGVPGVPENLLGTPGTPVKSGGVSDKTLKNNEKYREHPEHRQTVSHSLILREWRSGLSTLAYSKPAAGITTMRWGQLLDDAEYIFNCFGSHLVREGWSALDVFGVLPWREGGGVLLDRLQGARNLKLDGEGRAFWSQYGVTFQTSCDVGEHLVTSGLLLIWDRRMKSVGANA